MVGYARRNMCDTATLHRCKGVASALDTLMTRRELEKLLCAALSLLSCQNE